MAVSQKTRSKYGTLGLDVGAVGRWSRLIWGILILLPLALSIIGDFDSAGEALTFYGLTVLYFGAILAAYTGVYWFLGERLLAKANPWVNTVILVGPTLIVAWWDFILRPLIGVELPPAFELAMAFYIGISFILQWVIRYGGCEVVAIPIILFRRRYASYCIPLVALDAVEKVIVDRTGKTTQE